MTTDPWLSDLFAAIDEMDAERFVSFLSADAVFRYGSNPPVTSSAAIKDYVAQFFEMFRGLRHELQASWSHPETVFVQGDVTYTTHEGSEISVPFLNCFKMKGKEIAEYLIYIDPTPLAG